MRTVSTTDTTMTFSVRELAGVPVDSLDAERLSIGMELVQAVTERVIEVLLVGKVPSRVGRRYRAASAARLSGRPAGTHGPRV